MPDADFSVYVGSALIRDGVYGDGLGRLARHEAALMNAFTKTMKELRLLQESQSNRSGDALTFEATAPSLN
jgi:predicted GIY-YIG superfamily endonuclease